MVVPDVIRGDVEFPCAAMDDFVAVKGNGAPLFVLANVVDDIDMAITHVIRGEDLLPTTPKGILVWGSLAGIGWTTDGSCGAAGPTHAAAARLRPPAHAGQRGPQEAVQAQGPGRRRVLPRPGLPARRLRELPGPARAGARPTTSPRSSPATRWSAWFALADVNHSPAFFDVAKLTHMNGEYIRALSVDDFVEACRPWLEGDGAPWPAGAFDEAAFRAMAPVVQERVAVLGEVPAMVDFLFLDAPDIDPDSWAKAMAGDEAAPAILAAATAAYEALRADWTADALHAATLEVAESVGRKLGKAQAPIRVAVTGRRVGPPLFEALEVLGPGPHPGPTGRRRRPPGRGPPPPRHDRTGRRRTGPDR